jgi:hypothetical protein
MAASATADLLRELFENACDAEWPKGRSEVKASQSMQAWWWPMRIVSGTKSADDPKASRADG